MCDTKKCTKCGRELPLDQFYKERRSSTGLRSECKGCTREVDVKRRLANPEKKRISDARWRKNNLVKCRAYSVKCRKNNPEKSRATQLRWRRGNREKIRIKDRRDKKRLLVNDLDFRLKSRIRSAIWMALKDNTKSGHTMELLGCSIEYLRNYLECLFQPGMTWDNYGMHGWHIDHIIPLDYFDFSDPDQQKRAWHYTNLQPLWAVDNIRKSNKIEECQLVLL